MSFRPAIRLRRAAKALAGVLCLAAAACGDDLLTPEADSRYHPPAPTSSTFAFQLRGDPFLRLVGEQGKHAVVGLELDRALLVFAPDFVGATAPAVRNLATGREVLAAGLAANTQGPPEEPDILSAVLELTLERVGTVLHQLDITSPPERASSHPPYSE